MRIDTSLYGWEHHVHFLSVGRSVHAHGSNGGLVDRVKLAAYYQVPRTDSGSSAFFRQRVAQPCGFGCTCSLRLCLLLLMSALFSTAPLCAKAQEGVFIVCTDSLCGQCTRARVGTKTDWCLMTTTLTLYDYRVSSYVNRPQLYTGSPCTRSPSYALHTHALRTHTRSVHTSFVVRVSLGDRPLGKD